MALLRIFNSFTDTLLPISTIILVKLRTTISFMEVKHLPSKLVSAKSDCCPQDSLLDMCREVVN